MPTRKRKKKNIWPLSPSKRSAAQTMPASTRSMSRLRSTSPTPESRADRLNREFLERQKSVKRKNRDVIDRAVGTGMDISGHIYEVPYSLFQQGIKTALSLKDAVKKHVGLNPAQQNGEPIYLYCSDNGGQEAEYFMTLQPAQEEEWARYVRLAEQNPRKYRMVRPHRGKRRRNSQEAADEFYKKFHGEPSEETVIVEKSYHEHTHLGGVGPLVEIWVETPTGLVACIQFKRNAMPMLCSNEDDIKLPNGSTIKKGTQLFVEGGDQHVDLAKLDMAGPQWIKELMVLGTFAVPSSELEELQRPYLDKGEKYKSWNITYKTRKSFDDFELIDYQHDLGEGNSEKASRKEPPTLEYNPVDEQLYIVGGEYQIKLPMFGVSAGIEN